MFAHEKPVDCRLGHDCTGALLGTDGAAWRRRLGRVWRSKRSPRRAPIPRLAATRTSRPRSLWSNPGVTESAAEHRIRPPRGAVRQPGALVRCTSSDFALQQCSSNSQAGLVTVYANYKATTGELLGTAPLYDIEPGPDQTALFGFIVPIVDIPIQIPVAVRTGTDYGLRFTVSGLTQVDPLAQADITFWGFPASPFTIRSDSRKASLASRPAARARRHRAASRASPRASRTGR